MVDPSTARNYSPSRNRPRVKRAAIACEHCHQRKTRCDVMHGVPCTNCRLDKVHCTKRPPRNATGRNPRGKSQRQACDGPAHLAYGLSPSGEQVSETSAVLPAGPSALTSALMVNINRLPVAYYAFVDLSPIGHLPENEVLFLESQGCLHLPSRPVVETLLSHYFLYVHPTLPLVDESWMWLVYRQADQHKGELPLLLFHSMLFAAVPFVPEYVAKECGFPSLLTARDDFYRKANMLYTHMPDSDHITISQSALLLSYYNTSSDAMCNSTWLSVAIEHAKAESAHRYDELGTLTNKSRVMLKRLWWCCVLRDRIISLGMRRTLQISPDQFNTVGAAISLTDMQDELGGSEVYQADTKLALTWALIRLCHFASAVTDLLCILYPSFPDSEWGWNYTPEAHWESLQHASSSLSAWEADFVHRVDNDAVSQRQPSTSFFKKLTNVYHQAARIALCNHACQLAAQSERPQTIIDLGHYKSELLDAVSTMTDQLRQLIAANMAKYLPVSTLSSTPMARHRNAQQLSLFAEVNRLYSRKYDVARLCMMVDRAVQFAKPNILKLGQPTKRVGQAVSFVDMFDQEPDSYAGLCLYLDNLLSGQARVGQARPQRLGNMMSHQPQALPPSRESTQSVAVEEPDSKPDPKPTPINPHDHFHNVPLSSVLLTLHLNQSLSGMLQGLESDTNESTGPVAGYVNDTMMDENIQPEVMLDQSQGDCPEDSHFLNLLAILGE
ncbi:hypothetical protein ALT_9629 [Aspergillus lentulus]|uniref:Zn(2)-C6 fungal-type domain-containing protein n=1 Tax=Aspergillus lentulus TaxID=293939 RepID=A0AAN4PVR7_ASPLE|nr:hypothetical protein ALT_9629 [Aspergillus lentulus]